MQRNDAINDVSILDCEEQTEWCNSLVKVCKKFFDIVVRKFYCHAILWGSWSKLIFFVIVC